MAIKPSHTYNSKHPGPKAVSLDASGHSINIDLTYWDQHLGWGLFMLRWFYFND